MTTSNLLREMQLFYNDFTKTEKKIADYITDNPNRVLFMSITDLSEACGVADASVHRFCRTMGSKGYQEFKMMLSLSLSNDNKEDSPKAYPGEEEEVHVRLNRIMENQINAIRETGNLLRPKDVEKTVQMMMEARHIYFLGVGDSLLSALEARNKFLRITNKVSCIEDTHMQSMTVSMSGPEDLIIFISYSGSTKDNIYVANIANNVGAKTVAITRFDKSPLSACMDVTLICGSQEGPLEGGSMMAKMAQLYIIDVLFQEYYLANRDISIINNKKTSKAVVDKLF